MEYDVCEEGGIVAEHGADAIAALNDAAARKQAAPETLITILLSSNGGAPDAPLVGDGDGLAAAAFVEGALWARDFAEQNPDTFARLLGRETAQNEFDRRKAAS